MAIAIMWLILLAVMIYMVIETVVEYWKYYRK